MGRVISIVKQIPNLLYTREFFIFSLAFGVRLLAFCLLWWWFRSLGHTPDPGYLFPVLGGDSASYFTLAENLRQSGAFTLSEAAPFVPESFRLPGYPWYLYLFTFLPYPYVTAIIVQMMLAASSCVLLYKLGKKFLSEKGAFAGAILLSFEPTSIMFSTIIMSDTVFVFSLLLALYVLFKKPRNLLYAMLQGAAIGLLLGYAVLVRVIAQYLIPCLLAAYLFVFRKELRPWAHTLAKLSLVVAFAALAMLPWALRQQYWFNTYTLSSTPYINFTQYNLVYFYAYQHGISTQEAQHIYSDPIPYEFGTPWFYSLVNEPIFKQEMREGLEGQLIPYTKFHLIKALPFFLNDSLRDINRMIGILPPSGRQVNFTDLLLKKDFSSIVSYLKTPQPELYMLLIGSAAWISVSLLGFFFVLYTVLKRKKNVWFVLCCAGIILYFGILSSPVIQPRYRMPATPFMLLLAAEASILAYATLRKRLMREAR